MRGSTRASCKFGHIQAVRYPEYVIHLPWQRPFRDLVRRQLALFDADNESLIRRARTALQEYHDERDPSIALLSYADHDGLSEEVELRLYAMCQNYAERLDARTSRRYIREFDRQSRAAYRDLVPDLNLFGRNDPT